MMASFIDAYFKILAVKIIIRFKLPLLMKIMYTNTYLIITAIHGIHRKITLSKSNFKVVY